MIIKDDEINFESLKTNSSNNNYTEVTNYPPSQWRGCHWTSAWRSNVTPISPTFHDVHCKSCLLSSWLSKDKKREEDCSSYLTIYSRQSLSGPRTVKTYLNKEYFSLNRMWLCVVLFHSSRIWIYPHLHTLNITHAHRHTHLFARRPTSPRIRG